MSNDILRQADERLADWKMRTGFWYVTYYTFGILATVFVVTGAVKPPLIEYLGGETNVLYMAALFQGLNTFLLAFQKATAYRAAWRGLKFAVIDYTMTPPAAPPDPKKISDAIKAGWETIGHGYGGSTNG